MIKIKTPNEIKIMRKACFYAALILDNIKKIVQPGISTYDLDQFAYKLMKDYGVTSACYNYKSQNSKNPFPGYTCLSINEEVVHGIRSKQSILKEGDIISIDVCVNYRGYVGDNAQTIPVGKTSNIKKQLLNCTKKALMKGIEQAKNNNTVGDISQAIQDYVEKYQFSIVKDFVGHGIGKNMHEEPQIPNFGQSGSGPKLLPGMIIAIEPMVNIVNSDIEYANDGWTVLSIDRQPSAHFEHTILITENDNEILTILKNRYT